MYHDGLYYAMVKSDCEHGDDEQFCEKGSNTSPVYWYLRSKSTMYHLPLMSKRFYAIYFEMTAKKVSIVYILHLIECNISNQE